MKPFRVLIALQKLRLGGLYIYYLRVRFTIQRTYRKLLFVTSRALGRLPAPMVLESNNGNWLELWVVGYEFPFLAPNHPDANWLLIACRVETASASWHFVEPALERGEAILLANWLAMVAAGETEIWNELFQSDNPTLRVQHPFNSISFVEPMLAFSYCGASAGMIFLAVTFDGDARPSRTCDAVTILFEAPKCHLLVAVDSLRKQVNGFP